MSKMSSSNRNKYYMILVHIGAEECWRCGKVGNKKSLVIDHINNDNSDDNINNLQLLCRACNYLKNPRKIRMKNSVIPQSLLVDDDLPNAKSLELYRKEQYYPKFKKFLICLFDQYENVPVKEVINSGAMITSASTETVKRYLEVEASLAGEYKIVLLDNIKCLTKKTKNDQRITL
jgi:hypothetical protein